MYLKSRFKIAEIAFCDNQSPHFFWKFGEKNKKRKRAEASPNVDILLKTCDFKLGHKTLDR